MQFKDSGDKLTDMDTQPTNVEELFTELKDYGDTRLKLFKLKGIQKISNFASSLITSLLLVLLFLLVIICISIGLSLVIGEALGQSYYGFFIIGGVYLIVGIILFATKTKIMKTPISNKLIKDLMD